MEEAHVHDELAALVLSHCAAMHQAAVSPPYALYTCAALRGIPYRTYNSTCKFKKKAAFQAANGSVQRT